MAARVKIINDVGFIECSVFRGDGVSGAACAFSKGFLVVYVRFRFFRGAFLVSKEWVCLHPKGNFFFFTRYNFSSSLVRGLTGVRQVGIRGLW